MKAEQENELFARLAGDSRLEAWLNDKHAEAIRFLVEGTDAQMMNRAQGKARFIEDMKKLLLHGKTLR